MIIDIKLVIFPLNDFGVLFVTRLLRQSYNEGILVTEYLSLHMLSLTIFQLCIHQTLLRTRARHYTK